MCTAHIVGMCSIAFREQIDLRIYHSILPTTDEKCYDLKSDLILLLLPLHLALPQHSIVKKVRECAMWRLLSCAAGRRISRKFIWLRDRFSFG